VRELHFTRLAALGPLAGLGLAALFISAGLAEQLARADTEHSLRTAAWIIALAAPLLVARTRPVIATCTTAVLIAALPEPTGHFPPGAFAYVLPVLLSYWCGAHAATRPGLLATLALAAAIQIRMGFSEAPNLEIAIATLPPWWCGQEVRRRRLLVRELADRTRALEAEEEAFVRLSVERERARIARDLHDIVSHHLALIVIQAGAGRFAEPWSAEVAADRFATIRAAGVEALDEADRLVALLQPEGSDRPRLAPLLDRARALGARVVVTPPDLQLQPELEAVARHVAREALTNAMKHAPGAPLDIRLALDDRTLTITVHNGMVASASPLADTGSGLGLAGMRERLEALGGTLTAGKDENGGFGLSATLPLDETRREVVRPDALIEPVM
jgi:signal transduction histidine kinase